MDRDYARDSAILALLLVVNSLLRVSPKSARRRLMFSQYWDYFPIVGIIRVAAGASDEWVLGGRGGNAEGAAGLIRNTVANLLL